MTEEMFWGTYRSSINGHRVLVVPFIKHLDIQRFN